MDKFDRLKEQLRNLDRVLIAYSGGVDSTFLLKAASLSRASRVLAVTGVSESVPEEELSFAREMASALGVQHATVATEELRNEDYIKNSPDRCYYCKKELFRHLRAIASREDIPHILDGTNADDTVDWRPGRRAAAEAGVRSPLCEAGLGKEEIRTLSQSLRLPSWDKPATPCLSSRFPYGQRITAPSLARVHQAEQFIRSLGIRELRVRDHKEIARIEVPPDEFPKLLNHSGRQELVAYFRALGYRQVCLDLQGFRSGSSNEGLVIDDT